MTECQLCGAKSQLFLCRKHVDELADMLHGLPRWLRYLRDTALRQTRIGSDSRIRRTRGDEMPGLFEPDAEDHRANRPHLTKQGRASELLDEVTTVLATWIRHLCEERGIDAPAIGDPRGMARHLAGMVTSIAADPGAEQCYAEIDHAITEIDLVINRPEPRRFCGPCPTDVDRKQCGTLLYARRDAVEVTCPVCRHTHNIDALSRHLSARIDVLRYTAGEILVIMDAYGEPIPDRTWRRWRAEDRVKVRGWKRPDNADGTRGAIGIARHNDTDEPVYRLAEVRKVYAAALRHAVSTSANGD